MHLTSFGVLSLKRERVHTSMVLCLFFITGKRESDVATVTGAELRIVVHASTALTILTLEVQAERNNALLRGSVQI